MEYLTVQDVMGIIPLGKTKVTEIINSLPHINTGGKLFIKRHEFETWLKRNTVTGAQERPKPKATPKKKKAWLEMHLTEDGLIPYRRTKKGA